MFSKYIRLLFCIIICFAGKCISGENLLKNGSFEISVRNPEKETWADGWTINPITGPGQIQRELCDNAPDGKYILHIKTEKEIQIYSTDSFTSPETLQWSLKALSNNSMPSELRLLIYEYEIVDPLTKKEAFKETRLVQKIPLTHEWQSFTGILHGNISPKISARRLAFSLNGDLSIDNVRLEPVEKSPQLKRLFYLSFNDSTDAITEKGTVPSDIKGRVPFVPGKTGRGALFRNGNHLEFKAENHFDQNEGTFALWVKPLTDFDDGKPHCLAEVPLEPYRFLDSGFSITKGMTDQIAPYMFYAVNGPAWHANSFNAEPVWIRNKWVHLAVAWSQKKGILRVYADGKLIDEVLRPFEKRPDAAGRTLCIGGRMGGNSQIPPEDWDDQKGNIKRELPVDGAFGAEAVLDEIQIFDRMVNAEEAWKLAGNAGEPPSENIRPLSSMPLTTLPHELITQHTPFAKPLFQSPPKALFLIPSRVARDVVELWQRMDIKYEAFLLNKSKKGCPFQLSEFTQRFCYGATKDDRFKDITDKLSDNPDVLILSDISMDKVPNIIRNRILNMVNSGMGFVLINHDKHKIDYMKSKISDDAQDWLRRGIPWSGLPELLVDSTASQKKIPEKCIEAYHFGRGRIVSISFKEKSVPAEVGLTPTLYDTGYSREWDYRYTLYLAWIGKVICWASGRDSDLKLVFPPDGLRFERSTLPLTSAFNMSIQGLLPANAVLEYEIRDPQGIAEWKKKTVLRENNIQLAIPLLKAGLHYLSMRLEADGKTCDWGTITFHVKEKDEIRSIVLNSDSLERGEILRGKIQLIGPATKESLITVRTIDTVGRIYSQVQLSVAENIKEVSFALPINDPETIMSYIEAELCRNGNTVSTSSSQFFVPRRNMSAPETQEFPALAWWNISPFVGCSMIHARRLRELGFNIGLFWPYGNGPRNVAAWDFSTCAYMTALRMNADKKGWTVPVVPDITDGSWANPLVKEEIWRQVKSLLGDLRKYGPFFYSLGDENRYRGEMGFSPYGIKAYHEMQKKKYGSIDKLNQEWGTGYSSFEDVPRLTPAQARLAENAPALIDHRETNEALWRGMHGYLREKIREYDPTAKVGAEGSQTQDMEEMMDALDIWAPYGDPRGDILGRSLNKSNNATGHWMGAYYEGEQIPKASMTQLWKQLFSGYANMAFYFSAGPGLGESLLMADGSDTPFFMTQAEDWKRIVNGVGQLLRSAKPHMDGIAVHWSQESRILAEFGQNVENPIQADSQLIQIFRKFSLPGWRYVTRRQLEKGVSELTRVRILFLPASTCISTAEAATLTDFVNNGGTLVSLGIPGKRNEYGRQMNVGVLDSLMGFSRNKNVPNNKKSINPSWYKIDALTQGIPEGVDYTISVTDGKSLASMDSIPLIISKTSGKGKTLCINMDISHFNADTFSSFVGKLIGNSGVHPFAKFSPENGPGDRFGILESGSLILLGAIQDHRPEKWNGGYIQFHKKYHIYDVLHQKYIGFTDSIETKGLPDCQSACLFALQAEPVKSLDLDIPDKLTQGDNLTVKSKLIIGNTVNSVGRVIAIHVKGPEGKVRPYYRRMIYTHGTGDEEVNIRFALNDIPGRWEITATDAASGVSTYKTIMLTSKK